MFKLATRKVNRVQYSYYIALPLKWMEYWDLGAGNELDVFMDEEKNLVVRPVKEVSKNV